ncbi:hypothetical protein LAZ40_03120 [Cereibacter sphaeroides]|uniref:hypothetical protein n=1 Tax=Cereibacter sphaeroides TaxID=1063 RepID=UPI001F162C0B|nr:hypothetical protein [Cereibacter sphaeroides]MCE6958046.1 hypothetical protein [Cereibacter sphaeroides]MCE6971361.1 hypothetical protein [Cereibacter sphaeroides]
MLTSLSPDSRALFVCEKPSQARNFHAAWANLRPDIPFAAILACTHHPAGFRPRLPRDLPLHDIVIIEPAFATDVPLPVVVAEGSWAAGIAAPELLRQADVIVCATDPDERGAFAFENLLRQLAPERASTPWPRIHALTESLADLDRALRAPASTTDEVFRQVVSRTEARRFFDANWAAQSLPVFGALLREIGAPREVFVSKYALQLLWFLQDVDRSFDGSVLLHMMKDWVGTGRYPNRSPSGLGDTLSRGAILEQLEQGRLLERAGDLDRPGRTGLRISPLGRAFLARVHPKTRDADLPFRLQEWSEAWPASRPAMERYLKTVFGRQRRFQHAREWQPR